MSNHITIELCKEDRQRLDEIIGFLGWIVSEKKVDKTATATAEQQEPAEPVNEHPIDDVSPHADPEPAAEPEKPKANRADVQALVIKLAAPGTGKKDAVKAIVNEYAKKVSDIPEEKLDEVMAKLNELAEKE